MLACLVALKRLGMIHLSDPPKLTLNAAAIISGTFLPGTTDEDWQSVAEYLEWAAARDKAYANQVNQ